MRTDEMFECRVLKLNTHVTFQIMTNGVQRVQHSHLVSMCAINVCYNLTVVRI